MKLTDIKDGVAYRIEDMFEGHDNAVMIDITYSGGENDNELEFEWAVAEAKSNPSLTADELEEINDILECGREEDYVRELKQFYEGTEIKFLSEYGI